MENFESGRCEFAPVQQVGSRSPRPGSGLTGYPAEMYKRRFDAIDLQISRIAGECTAEEKFCLLACGHVDNWRENLYGFTRVVVHGADSVCIVARRKDLKRVIRQRKEVERYACNLKNALIYEAEDLALPLGDTGKMTSRSFKKPFVAVSVVPCTNKASGDEYDVDRAIDFLKEEMNSGATFTFGKTVKTAIFTLEHLFGKKFEAKEIRVFYVKNHIGRVMDSMVVGRSEKAKEVPFRVERSIMEHLAVVNKPQSGGSSSRKRERGE